MHWINQTRRETKEHAAAVAAIFAITLLFFFPLLRGRTFSMVAAHMFAQYPWAGITKDSPEVVGRSFPQTDHAEGLYPNSVFATNAVRSGQFPMWLPYSFSGIPIIETGVGNGFLYPPQLLAMTFLSPVRQHDLLLFTHMLLAGVAMYALLRCWGANAWGALFGAIVWELNGHNSFFLLFEFVAVAAAWFPLMMLGATMAVRKQSWRWAIATGVALGMSVLHGIQHFEYLGAVVLACWYGALTLLAARRLFKEGQRRSALMCLSLPVISAATAAALSAASWLSLISLLSHVHRQPLTLEQQLSLATPFIAFVRGLVFPISSLGPAGKQLDVASFAFIGIPALIFIPAAFFRRSAPVLLASIIGLVALGMFLGLRPLISFCRLALPYFGALRLWDGYYLFCFAIAVLAAFGLSEVIQRFEPRMVTRFLLRGFVFPLIAVECLQLIFFAWVINPTQPARAQWLFPETPMIANLKTLQGEFHVLPINSRDSSGRWMPPVFAGKVTANFDLRSGSGYESLLPVWTANLWRTVEQGGIPSSDIPPAYRPYFYHDQLPLDLFEKLSIGLIATPPNTAPRDADGSTPLTDGSLQLVYKGPDGWIYKLQHALPRAFLVPQILAAPKPGSALGMLVDRNFDARQAAIVIGEKAAAATGLPSLNTSGVELAASANIVSDRVNDVEVEVNTSRAAMLVLNDSWDSGWKAHVDGVEQPVLRVNYAFRGVVVPEGKHRVVFLYRPPLLLLGLSISAVTMLLLVIVCAWISICWLHGRRKRNNEHVRQTSRPVKV